MASDEVSTSKVAVNPSPRMSPELHIVPPDSASPTSIQDRSIQRRDDSPEEPGQKTISINITIKYPENLLPRFNYRNCRRQRRGGNRKHGVIHPILKVYIILAYLSFFISGAVSWGLRPNWAPLIIATFSPFLDILANGAVVYLLKKDRDRDPKKPRFGLAALLTLQLNIVLVVLHIVIMVYVLTWRGYGYPWYYYIGGQKRAIVGMMLHSMISMLVFKFILFVRVLHYAHRKEEQPSGYQSLAQSEEARIRPGTVVDFSEDEQTPRNSQERVRLL